MKHWDVSVDIIGKTDMKPSILISIGEQLQEHQWEYGIRAIWGTSYECKYDSKRPYYVGNLCMLVANLKMPSQMPISVYSQTRVQWNESLRRLCVTLDSYSPPVWLSLESLLQGATDKKQTRHILCEHWWCPWPSISNFFNRQIHFCKIHYPFRSIVPKDDVHRCSF
jgi:hypothetical protein